MKKNIAIIIIILCLFTPISTENTNPIEGGGEQSLQKNMILGDSTPDIQKMSRWELKELLDRLEGQEDQTAEKIWGKELKKIEKIYDEKAAPSTEEKEKINAKCKNFAIPQLKLYPGLLFSSEEVEVNYLGQNEDFCLGSVILETDYVISNKEKYTEEEFKDALWYIQYNVRSNPDLAPHELKRALSLLDEMLCAPTYLKKGDRLYFALDEGEYFNTKIIKQGAFLKFSEDRASCRKKIQKE